ncbi:MAG: hypothetical protein WKG00_28775 [Polyangiaceae bacterium]
MNCPSCGSANVEAATLMSTAITLARSTAMKKVFNTGGEVHCDVCMDCGMLHRLRGKAEDLKKLLPE